MVSQIKLESLLDKEIIPKNITNNQETGDTINLLIHLYYQELIEEGNFEENIKKVLENLNQKNIENKIPDYLYEKWFDILINLNKDNIDVLTENSDLMQELRSSSPFIGMGMPNLIREQIIDFVFTKYKTYKNEKRRLHSTSCC